MARTLNATLQTAQTATSRHPICELTVGKGAADIPFPANAGFSADANEQYYPTSTVLSDGKMAVFYIGNSYSEVRCLFSDAARTAWGNYSTLWSESGTKWSYLECCPLDDGNIGAVSWGYGSSSTAEKLTSFRVSTAGALLNRTEIENTDTGSYTRQGCCLVHAGTNSYAIIYIKYSGGNYVVYKRTSSDFISWSAASTLTIPGLTAGRVIKEPDLIKLADGSFMLLFSYQDTVDGGGSIYNIWYSTSADLTTWTDAAQLTDTTLKSRDYYQPSIVQKQNGSLFVSVQEANSYLSMDSGTTGWTGYEFTPSDMWIDTVNGKLYVTCVHSDAYRSVQGFAKIDIATWTVDQSYDGTSTPAIPDYFLTTNWWDSMKAIHDSGNGPLAPILGDAGICLLNFDEDNYRTFMFADKSSYGEDCAKNVNWTPYTGNWSGYDPTVNKCWVDVDNNRLYVYLAKGHLYDNNLQFGYIDLDQTGPDYDFTTLVTLGIENSNPIWNQFMRVYPDDDILLMGGCNVTHGGRLLLVKIGDNAIYKYYRVSDHPDFPYGGVIDAVLVGDKVFATVCYCLHDSGEAYKYWLLEIDLTTDVMVYHYPPHTSDKRFNSDTQSNGYPFGRIYHSETTSELIIDGSSNPVVFNYSTYAWEYIDYDTEGSAPTPANDPWEYLIYDATTDNYFGYKNDGTLYLMPRDGSATRVMYVTGESGTFEDPEILISGYTNTQNQIALTETNEVWSFWRDTSETHANISWGKTDADLEVSDYLTGELTAEWSIDGTPNKLTFSLSHGHLFDPANANSILSYYLEKGNIATLRFGDTVSGTNYWENQGTFIVREIKLRYKRGEYPTAEVSCEDVRYLWGLHQIAATQVTASNPDDAIISIIKANTALEDADFDIPTFSGEFEFDANWIDRPLAEIVADIAHRWQYFLIMDMDNKVAARLINTEAAADNTYSSTAQLIEFTPDDSFGDLTNRITVTGQSLDDIEVLYSEERLGGLAGTIGWWGFNGNRTVYYSDDRSKRAKFPRLKIIESSTSIMFDLAGSVTESISDTDPFNKYCVVSIEAPNLTPILVAAIAGWVSAHYIPDKVASTVAGLTIPWGRVIESTFLLIALNVLGSVANYQFEIWGRPMGYVKRDYAASADDVTLQEKLGMVVEERHEGFLCYTQDMCQTVADFEMLLAQCQRNRVSFSKTAHLQDEVGDILSVPHPYTGNALKILVAGLKRRYLPGNDGHFLDEIEGWNVS